jgi:hypothetical protein
MVVGTGGAVPDYIANSGFAVTDRLHILGVDITRNSGDLQQNFSNVIEKIRKVGNFWCRYRLSLIGRVNVAKTLMLSQISYIGSFIQPSEQQLLTMQSLIHDFISSNLKVGRKYIDLSVKKGGIGMINIKNFLTGIQCSWIKRCFRSKIDIWRKKIDIKGGGNALTITAEQFDAQQNPVLSTLARSFDSFKTEFYKQNDNFLDSYVLGNPLLINNRREKIPFHIGNLLRGHQNNSFLQLKQLLTIDGRPLPKPELQVVIGCDVSEPEYLALTISLRDSMAICEKSKIPVETGIKCTPLGSFITRFKKGSPPFRKVFSQNCEHKLKVGTKPTTKTFFRLISNNVLPEPELEKIFGLWNQTFFPNKLREFIYKFNNNILGLNVRVSHFNQNISRNCTFCRLQNVPVPVPIPDETFIHLFFSCAATGNVLTSVKNRLFPEINLTTDSEAKYFYFCGLNPQTKKVDNLFLQVLTKVIMYSIWESKLSKQLPSIMKVTNDIFFLIENMRRYSNKLRQDMNIGLTICRIWQDEASRRR